MSGYSQVKGITVKINGDTTGLQKALNNVKAQTAGLDKTMSKLKSSMKLNPGDFQSFATYQDLLKDKITSTTKQMEVYSKAIKNYPKTHEQWASAVSNVKTELTTYDSALSNTKTTLSKLKKEQKTNINQMDAWNQAFSKGMVTTEQYEKVMGDLSSKHKGLSKEISSTVSRQKELTQNSASLKTELKNLGGTFEESQQSLKGMNAAQLTLKNQLKQLSNEFITTNKNVLKIADGFKKASASAEKLAETIKPLSIASAALIAGSTAVAVSFEDAFTGVTKTVDATPKQLSKINDGLKQLAQTTASSYQDIASYAELAGQMGIPTESIVGFTKTITQLGDTTNLVGEEAAQAVAKIANIMVSDSKKTNTYFQRMGSTIVDLGNKFATTESDIVATTKKLATAGRQAGMTTSDVLAISTALSSLGIEAQAGGGSVSKMIKTIQLAVSTGNDNLQKYAEVAGMTSEQFQQAWGEDAANAFLKFVDGIGKSGDVTKTLDELGITEVRQSQAMGALAQSSEVLARALNVSDSAWQSNSAMATEAEKRYKTLKSQLSQTWETVKQAGNELGQAFTPTLTKVLKVVKKAANAFIELDDGTKETIAKMLALTAVAYPVTKGFKLITGALGDTITKLASLPSKAKTAYNVFKLCSDIAPTASIAFAGIGIGVAAATAELAILVPMFQKANKKALESAVKNDAVAQSYVKMADSLGKYNNKIEEYSKKADQSIATYETEKKNADSLVTTIKQLNEVENKSSIQKQMLQEAVDQLNQIYPDLGLTIDQTTGKIADNTGKLIENNEELDNNIKKVQEAARQEAYADAIKQQTKSLIKQKTKYSEVAQAVSGLGDKIDTLKKKQKEAMNEGDQQKVLKYQGQIEQLKKKYDELTETLGTFGTKMQETQKDLLDYTNQMETGGLTEIGQTLKDSLQGCIDKAKEAGVEIPTQLTEGIMNGSVDYQTASEFVASQLTFQELEANAGEAGLAIPSTLANQIIAGAGSVQEANTMLNNLIQFNDAVAKAGIDASQLDTELVTAIANGEYPVEEAMSDLGNGGVEALNKHWKKLKNKTGDTVDEVTSKLKSNKPANAADSSGAKVEQKWGVHLDTMVSDTALACGQISDLLSNLESSANAKAKRIKTTISSAKIVEQSTDSDRPVFDDVMALDADNLVQPLTLPETIDTAVMSSRIIGESSIRSNSRIDALSNKLDSFIDAFMNSSLTVNLQPMELDGGIITDVVQEHISIRDLLSSWGKGDSGSSSVSSISSKELLNTWNK